MKERFRKQKFLKNFGLQPNKNPRPTIPEDENVICERVCFYYYDDNAQVICRGCYKSYSTWLDFRKHFNTPSCHITETNYKLNTYNDVYKKYKLRKAKTKKRINDSLSAAQLMDIETLNTRKTRKRCYTNTRVVANNTSKSATYPVSTSAEKTAKIKEEAFVNCVSIDESVEEMKPKSFNNNIVTKNIPNSTKTTIQNLSHDNQSTLTIKTEWKADGVSQVSSGNQSTSTAQCLQNYESKENKDVNYKYVCVICDKRFMSKCLLTIHQVQHIKSDRSSYGVFMAALARTV